MSKIVLDTNVVIAAFAVRGLCESVFELCLESHDLITSDFILDEIRNKLTRKLKLSEQTVSEIIKLLKTRSELVIPQEIKVDTCRDPKDLPVLGTCLSGKADYLISGDKDLLELESFEKTLIVSPRNFYESQK